MAMMKGKMGGAMKDGSRNSMPSTTMNGRIEPGMTPSMRQTKSMSGGMPMGAQTKGSGMAGNMMGRGMGKKGGY